jgi:hypothetical protein
MDDMKTLADSMPSFGVRFYFVWQWEVERERVMERERTSKQSVGLATGVAMRWLLHWRCELDSAGSGAMVMVRALVAV